MKQRRLRCVSHATHGGEGHAGGCCSRGDRRALHVDGERAGLQEPLPFGGCGGRLRSAECHERTDVHPDPGPPQEGGEQRRRGARVHLGLTAHLARDHDIAGEHLRRDAAGDAQNGDRPVADTGAGGGLRRAGHAHTGTDHRGPGKHPADSGALGAQRGEHREPTGRIRLRIIHCALRRPGSTGRAPTPETRAGTGDS